jgi:hypothetical protein
MGEAATLFFLFAIITGQQDAAALTTLGEFTDQATCQTAAQGVEAAMKDGTALAHVFCVSSDDVTPLAQAAQAGQTP